MIDRLARAREIMRRANDDGRWQDGVEAILALCADVEIEGYWRGRCAEYRPNHLPRAYDDGTQWNGVNRA